MTTGVSRPRKRSATRSVTLADVAGAAGVSAQTVSRAIREPDSVGDQTRTRIEEAIAATGYVRNLTASNLASNRSLTVAALLPDLNASVFAETVHSFAAELAGDGYQIFVGTTDYRPEHEEELVASFLGRRPDGVLMIGTSHTERTRALLRGVPVVETWGWTSDPLDLLVGFSHADATAALVEHLASRGRRRITFAGRQLPGDSRAAERLAGYAVAVRALGAEPRVVDSGGLPATMETGVTMLGTVLDRFPETDAIVFASDVYAAGALLACVRRGLDVPGRLAIAGFGDFELSRHLVPSLTTVAVPNTEVGALAARLLRERMAGREVAVPARDVGYQLVVREST